MTPSAQLWLGLAFDTQLCNGNWTTQILSSALFFTRRQSTPFLETPSFLSKFSLGKSKSSDG